MQQTKSNLICEEFVLTEDLNSDFSSYFPFQQTDLYGNWHKGVGRKVRKFLIKRDDSPIIYFQVIIFPLPFGKTYMYVPYGPITREYTDDSLSFLKQKIQEISLEVNSIFCRLDFSPSPNEDQNLILERLFSKVPSDTYNTSFSQPRTEWFLDISESEGEILANMHSKTRYGTSYGLGKGLSSEIISENLDSHLEKFLTIQKETASRGGFKTHLDDYYKSAFESSSRDKSSFIVSVSFESEIVAMLFVVCKFGIANYVFGGSTSSHKNLMPSNLAHFEAIREAKRRGMRIYNFGGISSEDSQKSSWDGLTSFKKKFGGYEFKHGNFFDLITSPIWYTLYKIRKNFQK